MTGSLEQDSQCLHVHALDLPVSMHDTVLFVEVLLLFRMQCYT